MSDDPKKPPGPNGKTWVRKKVARKRSAVTDSGTPQPSAETAPPAHVEGDAGKRLRKQLRDLETHDRRNARKLTHKTTSVRKGCAQVDALPKPIQDRIYQDCMELKGYAYTADWLHREGFFKGIEKLQLCKIMGQYRRGLPGLCRLAPFSRRLVERAKKEVDLSLDLHREITHAAMRLRKRIAIREAREHIAPERGDGRPYPEPFNISGDPDDLDSDSFERPKDVEEPAEGVEYYCYDKTISSDVELYMRMLGKLHEIRMDLGYAGGKNLGAAVDTHPGGREIREKHGDVVEATFSNAESSAKVLSIYKQLKHKAASPGGSRVLTDGKDKP